MSPASDYNSLALIKMASGHLCLNLTNCVSWSDFPAFVDRFVGWFGGAVTKKADGADLRIWEISLKGRNLRLVFDDYPVMVSLESADTQGDAILEELHRDLSDRKV